MPLSTITIHGNIVRDPEVRHTQGGKQVATFAVAVNHDKEKVSFFDVECWDKTAETAEKYLVKGKQIVVSGQCHIEDYETKNGEKRRKVVVKYAQFSFCGSRDEDGSAGTHRPRETAREDRKDAYRNDPGPIENSATDDDLPF